MTRTSEIEARVCYLRRALKRIRNVSSDGEGGSANGMGISDRREARDFGLALSILIGRIASEACRGDQKWKEKFLDQCVRDMESEADGEDGGALYLRRQPLALGERV